MAKKQAQKIFILTREYDGLAGAGGVKDFSRQLAEALVRKGRQVSVLMPLYGFIDPRKSSFKKNGNTFAVDMPYVGRFRREAVTIWSTEIHGVKVYLADAARYREKRDVYVYTGEDGGEDPHNQKGMAHYDQFSLYAWALTYLPYEEDLLFLVACSCV